MCSTDYKTNRWSIHVKVLCSHGHLYAAVYEVRVGRFPSCTCPDAAIRGNLCKHYLYVMIRVLRLKDDDPLVWQRALLTSEAEEVCAPHQLCWPSAFCQAKAIDKIPWPLDAFRA